jgi:hypothetical protein
MPVPWDFTPDGLSLVVLRDTLSVWDIRTGQQKTSWSLLKNKVLDHSPGKPHSWEWLQSIVVSPDGNKVAFGLRKDRGPDNRDGDWFARVLLFETATGRLLH